MKKDPFCKEILRKVKTIMIISVVCTNRNHRCNPQVISTRRKTTKITSQYLQGITSPLALKLIQGTFVRAGFALGIQVLIYPLKKLVPM